LWEAGDGRSGQKCLEGPNDLPIDVSGKKRFGEEVTEGGERE
jgi:hypothetical protein